jgi:hypothetical protein
LRLADLIDLEWLLRDDAELADDLVVAARSGVPAACAASGVDPGHARGRVDVDRALRERLAATLLRAARATGAARVGPKVAAALGHVRLILIALGAMFGVGTATAVLHYDGKTPVNVVYFAGIFFALQLALLVILLVVLLLRPARDPDAGPGLAASLIRWLVTRFAGSNRGAIEGVLGVWRGRRGLYLSIERWTLFELAQGFGLAFNVAALITTLLLVTGTDLVFCWSTTLDVRDETVHSIASAFALPWSFLGDAVVPLDVVRASRWVRMPGEFRGGLSMSEAAALAAQWWRYLVAGLIAYGLLPRLIATIFARIARMRALAHVGLDHAGYHSAFDRLLPHAAAWSGPEPDDIRGTAPVDRVETYLRAAPPPSSLAARTIVIAWGSAGARREELAAVLAAKFAGTAEARVAAGTADVEDDARAIATARSRPFDRAIVVFAAGCQPNAEILAFLRELRTAMGGAKRIVVLVVASEAGASGVTHRFVDAESAELDIWRRSLASLADPFLAVDTVGGAR